jgi:hypothetical protein
MSDPSGADPATVMAARIAALLCDPACAARVQRRVGLAARDANADFGAGAAPRPSAGLRHADRIARKTASAGTFDPFPDRCRM